MKEREDMMCVGDDLVFCTRLVLEELLLLLGGRGVL